MKIIFAGTPEFAVSALAALHAAGHTISLVLTQPDRPAGRGMQLHPSPVKQFALAHAIPVAQPTSLRLDGKYAEEAQAAHALLKATEHDVMVVAAYGLILPQSVLQIPRLGCINIHGSLLPRWRGAAPIHRAIEIGDKQTGITIMQMDEGLDTGAMLLSETAEIYADDTTGLLHDRLANMGGRLIVDAMRALESGKLLATPQPEIGVTYAAKISKQEAVLNFQDGAEVLERKVRAFNPFPAASAEILGITLKIWHAQYLDVTGEPGQILSVADDGVTVACGRGALVLKELQKPGGKRLPAAEFLKGFPMKSGQRFEIHS
jgi:methionyl-tRNA formyltransferase